MPFLIWLGRAQNKNVLKTILLYGSSLSVLPKVMNHLVNQTGILWFLICLPLISWVAFRNLIWDCLPFLHGSWKGSVESDGEEQEHFPVAAQGRALPRRRLTIHISSHHFCFIAPFSELPSQDICHMFSHPPILSFSCFHLACPGRERSLRKRGGGLQAPSKWQQQHQGRGCHAALILWAVCQHLAGSLWAWAQLGHRWAGASPLPSTAPAAAACGRGAELRSWRQWHFKHCRCLLSGCESV